jgi:oligosaccharide repeat unit polymerase
MTSALAASGPTRTGRSATPAPDRDKEPIIINPVIVQISSAQRRALILILLAYLTVIGSLNLSYGQDNSFFLFLSFAAQTVVMFAPLALAPGIGPLHVLAFPALWWFANVVLRQGGALVTGLAEHAALPNVSTGDLNLLWASWYLLNALAQASFILGYFLVRSARVPTFRFGAPGLIRPKMMAILLGSLVCLGIYSQMVGGFEGMLLMRSVGRITRTELTGGGHFAVLLSVPCVSAVIWFGFQPNAYKSWLFLATVGFGLMCVFLATGSRAAVLYPPSTLLIVHALHRRKLPKPVTLLGVGLTAWMLMGLVTVYRTSHFGRSSVDWFLFEDYAFTDVLSAGSEELVNRATTRSSGLPVLHHVPNDSPLLLGATYLRVLLAPIPQFFLPFEKPTAAGRLNGQMFFNIDAGIPVGPVIEAYWNFHVVGVVIVYILAGAINSYVLKCYLANSRSTGATGLYALFLFYVGYDSDAATRFLQLASIGVAVFVFFCGLPRIAGWVRVRIANT